ncbi:MAG: AzlD domain-containing protein, partial [Rubrivivax sp.]
MSTAVQMSWPLLLALTGLAAVTLLTRGFFLLPQREWPLPAWLRKGLRYAPLAALTAVVVPEVVTTQGVLITTWKDARLFAALAGALYYA